MCLAIQGCFTTRPVAKKGIKFRVWGWQFSLESQKLGLPETGSCNLARVSRRCPAGTVEGSGVKGKGYPKDNYRDSLASASGFSQGLLGQIFHMQARA